LNKYQDLLVALASKLKERRQNSVILEVMNEPSAGWNQPYNWFEIQARFVVAVRRVAPVLPLIVTGDRGGGIDGLLRLNPQPAINDPMILYSFSLLRANDRDTPRGRLEQQALAQICQRHRLSCRSRQQGKSHGRGTGQDRLRCRTVG